MQLDLFEQVAPDQLMMKFLELKESQEKLRRGLFQRVQDLKNAITDIQIKMEEMANEKHAS